MLEQLFQQDVPTKVVETAIPTRVVETAIPTKVVVGTATQEFFFPAIIVGTAVPTIIVETAYYLKSCSDGPAAWTVSALETAITT